MKQKLFAFLSILAGNGLLAFAVCAFVVPNGFMLGGSNGIALALHTFIPLPLSLLNAIIVAVSRAREDEVRVRLEKLEHIWDEYDVYDKNQG